MPTPIANKNRAGLMGPEQVRTLGDKVEQGAITAAVSAETTARNAAIAAEASARDAAIASGCADAVRRALNHTIWIAG